MRRVLLELGLGALLTMCCVLAAAADLSQVAGHYRYDRYIVKLPNGREVGLNDLGATEASLDAAITPLIAQTK